MFPSISEAKLACGFKKQWKNRGEVSVHVFQARRFYNSKILASCCQKSSSVIVVVFHLHGPSCVTQYGGCVYSSDCYLNDTTALNAENVHVSVGSCS